jgi:hypothetical protein
MDYLPSPAGVAGPTLLVPLVSVGYSAGKELFGPFSSWMEPFAARARKLGWNVHTMSAGHDVMITHSNELAEILLRIAKE